MIQLILMQGPSGSGKSTVAATFGMRVVSTDDFHFIGDEYLFQPQSLGYYHAWNLFEAEHWLSQGQSIVVDNCNILKAHAQPYIDLATKYGAEVIVRRCEGRHANLHGVPDAVVEWMAQAMEPLQ